MIETDLIYQNGFQLLKIKVQGTMTGAVVGAGMEALNVYEEYAAGVPVLWDLREADLSQYTTAEMEITNQLLQHHPGRRNVKSASLVPDRGAMLLARLWEVYGVDRFPLQRRAFLKLEDAMEWLTSDAGA
ncbi:hypothetical protein [Nisaea nitritireducens]|uniref:hypothetical protein n=1 Tax=Nisaea nitritireducens TaxID=568392 RepID=UPI0018671AD8|nr:hypothetical protein [Nisaea nitritireducens]